MRYSAFGFLLLTSCGAAEVQSQKLKDGSWQFQCELAMDECLRRVQSTCRHERYRILSGTSETRLRDAPPFERAYHSSRVHLVCTDDGSNAIVSLGGDDAAKPAATSCSKGETRACTGPGACQGGQQCLPDGSGFGSCDCGNVTTNPSAGAASTIAPPVSPSVNHPTESVPATPPGSTSAPPTPAP